MNEQTIKQLKKASVALVEARRALQKEGNPANAIHRIALMQVDLCKLLSDVMTPDQNSAWQSFQPTVKELGIVDSIILATKMS